MSAFTLACASFGTLVTLIASWLTMIKRVRIEQGRWWLRFLAAASIATAGLAFSQGPALLGGVLAGVSLVIPSIFLVLSSLASQSHQLPAVAVGQPLPAFSAPDENGNLFTSASLSGKPILLKFFRGHW